MRGSSDEMPAMKRKFCFVYISKMKAWGIKQKFAFTNMISSDTIFTSLLEDFNYFAYKDFFLLVVVSHSSNHIWCMLFLFNVLLIYSYAVVILLYTSAYFLLYSRHKGMRTPLVSGTEHVGMLHIWYNCLWLNFSVSQLSHSCVWCEVVLYFDIQFKVKVQTTPGKMPHSGMGYSSLKLFLQTL